MAMIRVSEEARRWLNDKAYEQREPVSIVLDRMIWGKAEAKATIKQKPTKAKAKKKVKQPLKCSGCGETIFKTTVPYAKDSEGKLFCVDCIPDHEDPGDLDVKHSQVRHR